MAWMDHYEQAELRKGEPLEDLFGPEYEGLYYPEPEYDTDPYGWEYRGDPDSGHGYFYLVLHHGDFQAFVVPDKHGYEVFARGPAGHSTRRTVLPEYSVPEAKAYAMKLVAALRARALGGSPA